jgi:hypothetical protein
LPILHGSVDEFEGWSYKIGLPFDSYGGDCSGGALRIGVVCRSEVFVDAREVKNNPSESAMLLVNKLITEIASIEESMLT